MNIKTRLEFLGLLLTSGSAPLSGEVLGQLWTELVGANITPAEREVFFEWISNIISSAGAPTRGTTDIVDEVCSRCSFFHCLLPS